MQKVGSGNKKSGKNFQDRDNRHSQPRLLFHVVGNGINGQLHVGLYGGNGNAHSFSYFSLFEPVPPAEYINTLLLWWELGDGFVNQGVIIRRIICITFHGELCLVQLLPGSPGGGFAQCVYCQMFCHDPKKWLEPVNIHQGFTSHPDLQKNILHDFFRQRLRACYTQDERGEERIPCIKKFCEGCFVSF